MARPLLFPTLLLLLLLAPAARAAPPPLEGVLRLAPGTPALRGRLVLGWRTPTEQQEFAAGRGGLALLRRMVERFEVGAEVDFARTPAVPYRISGAPAGGVPVVILDVEQAFWSTLLGGGPGLTGTGPAGGGEVLLTARRARRAGAPAPAQRREPCAGPRFRLIELDAPGLPPSRGLAVSDPAPPTRTPAMPAVPRRRFCAYLPPSWASSPARRYPVVWLFPGLTSTEMAYLSGRRHLGHRLDALTAQTGREAILVGVDTSTPQGSTYLEDSAQGPFGTFLSGAAMAALEQELRAIPRRTGRAVLGQSTGGFNALSFGLRHSSRFSVIGASSPDAPDPRGWLLEPGTRRAREWLRRWTRLEDALGGAGQMISYAADWSEASAPARRWPFDLATGAVDETVMARWVARSPHGLLRDPAFAARARADLSGRILITVGRNDEFELFAPAERFAAELGRLGIVTRFVPTDDGHGNEQARLEVALRFALERLEPATPAP